MSLSRKPPTQKRFPQEGRCGWVAERPAARGGGNKAVSAMNAALDVQKAGV